MLLNIQSEMSTVCVVNFVFIKVFCFEVFLKISFNFLGNVFNLAKKTWFLYVNYKIMSFQNSAYLDQSLYFTHKETNWSGEVNDSVKSWLVRSSQVLLWSPPNISICFKKHFMCWSFQVFLSHNTSKITTQCYRGPPFSCK